MKNTSFHFAVFLMISFFSMLMISCGPSAEEIRQQEIADSIKLEEDRRELLQRAAGMFDNKSDTTAKEEETAEKE